MATTVGIPAAIASELILSGRIFAFAFQLTVAGKVKRSGVLRPVTKDLYEPILSKLQEMGINVIEETF